ncbi:MAG: glycine cleavage system protein GcvH [Candidatus Eisenbacteria bacterium]|nr:glycine cleavage system protein GcvH [Candidatus Eisenbacteria bacterium]
MNVPEDLKYTREHEWVLVEGKIATVGITDYAQSELGDIVYLEFPAVGDRVRLSESAGTIEAVKTVADLFAPLSGEVLEVNETLPEEPERVNRDPYGEGWMFKLSIEDPSELEELLGAADYKRLVEESRR